MDRLFGNPEHPTRDEDIPVIVHDNDKPLMMPANILSLALERGWLKGREQMDKGGSLTHNNVPN